MTACVQTFTTSGLLDVCTQTATQAAVTIACVAGGSGCACETFCGEAGNSLAAWSASEIQLDSSPFFSRPDRLFALAFGTARVPTPAGYAGYSNDCTPVPASPNISN